MSSARSMARRCSTQSGTLRQLGVLLVPSSASEIEIDPFRGTRHTSARRYSFDDPTAIVVVVSEQGPVTVLRAGQIIGRSPVVPGLVAGGRGADPGVSAPSAAPTSTDRDYRHVRCRKRSPRSPRSCASTARDRAGHTAIIQGERTLTWAELYERACRVAQALAGRRGRVAGSGRVPRQERHRALRGVLRRVAAQRRVRRRQLAARAARGRVHRERHRRPRCSWSDPTSCRSSTPSPPTCRTWTRSS